MRRALPAAVLLLVVSCMSVQAQAPTKTPAPAVGPGRIISTVVDEKGDPRPSAVVVLRSARDSSVVARDFTDNAGRAVITGLPLGNFYLRVFSIGYKASTAHPIQLTGDAASVNTGVLKLEVDPVQLGALEAAVQQSPVILESDRTVYSTKDMAAAAGTAVDILRSIPELEVAVNGKVTMRGGQDVAIYLNGRPAPVTGEALAVYLQQFPGSMIAKVEVMSNPSAKYDPDGMVGIVNIQLKDIVGGSVSLATTSRMGRIVSALGGHKKGAFSLLASGSINSSNSEVVSYDRRQNLLANSFVEQRGNIDGDRRLSQFDVTADFELNPNKLFWASTNAFWNSSWQTGFAHYEILDEVQAVRDGYDRDHSNEGGYHNITVGAGFKHTVQQKEDLSIELRRTMGSQSATHRLTRQFFMWNGGPVTWPDEVTLGDFSTENESVRAQVDHWRMLGARTRLEAGYSGYNRSETQDNRLNVKPQTVQLAATTSTRAAYHYEETFHSFYGVVSRPLGKLSAQLGVRAEIAKTQFDLPVAQETYEDDYNSVYPSVNLLYNLGQNRAVRLGYSRRITRPVPSYLNPSVAQLDPLNRTAGNPTLKAMYADVMNLEFTKSGSRGNLRINPYYRRAKNNWEPIKRVDSLGISTVSWENSASLASYGVEMTTTAFFGTRVSNVSGFGLNRDVRDADNLTSIYVRDAVRWNVNTNFGVRVTPTTNVQVYARYIPAYDLVQGRVEGRLYSTLGFRQQIIGRKGLIHFQIIDPFDLQRYRFETHDESHVQLGRSNYKERVASLSVSYTFGSSVQQQIRRPADEQSATQLPVIR